MTSSGNRIPLVDGIFDYPILKPRTLPLFVQTTLNATEPNNLSSGMEWILRRPCQRVSEEQQRAQKSEDATSSTRSCRQKARPDLAVRSAIQKPGRFSIAINDS